LIVLALTFALLSFLPLFVVPEFKKMFEEFELELPPATELLIEASDILQLLASQTGLWILFGIVILVVVLLALPGISGIVRGRRILATVPIIGPLWHWSGAAEFSQMLAILLDEGIGLPEALRLTADGLNDPDLSDLCNELSRGVHEGRTFSELLASTSRLPPSIIPLVRWGEKTGELPEALRSASNMMLGRIRLRAMLLRSISPPVVFLLVFLSIGSMIVSLFMPLVSLIQGLS
jgi:type II secretory pathway component PulF